jgi:prevent-host-death family protein
MKDMRDTYSLYEAKAKLSAIIRRVREGRRAIVTVHGQPVAEIRPIEQGAGDLAARLERLVEHRIVIPAERRATGLRLVTRKPGALARFLADRDA